MKTPIYCLAFLISSVAVCHENVFEPWPAEECKKVSVAAGSYLYVSGLFVAEADRLEKEGNGLASQETLKKALLFSGLSRNAAEAFSAFCKS